MARSGHLRSIARSPFPQRRSLASNIVRGKRSLGSRKKGKSGHLCSLGKSPFPRRRTRTRKIVLL
eukprot:2058318-Ditylum_brightwellii.AAC.1